MLARNQMFGSDDALPDLSNSIFGWIVNGGVMVQINVREINFTDLTVATKVIHYPPKPVFANFIRSFSFDDNGDVYYINTDGELIRGVYKTGETKTIKTGLNTGIIIVGKTQLFSFTGSYFGTIQVLDKTTGEVVNNITIPSVPSPGPHGFGGQLTLGRNLFWFELRGQYGDSKNYVLNLGSHVLRDNGSGVRAVFALEARASGQYTFNDSYAQGVCTVNDPTGTTENLRINNPSNLNGYGVSVRKSTDEVYMLFAGQPGTTPQLLKYTAGLALESNTDPGIYSADGGPAKKLFALKDGLVIRTTSFGGGQYYSFFALYKYGTTSPTHINLGESYPNLTTDHYKPI